MPTEADNVLDVDTHKTNIKWECRGQHLQHS